MFGNILAILRRRRIVIVVVNTKSTQKSIFHISQKYFQEMNTIVYPQTSPLPMHDLCTTSKALQRKLAVILNALMTKGDLLS